MVRGLNAVQSGLLSYEWLTNSDDCEAGVGFANQVGLKTELDDTKFSYQLIMTITLAEDLRKDKNLVKNSENFHFMILLQIAVFEAWLVSCRCYGDYIEVCHWFI